MEVMLLDSPCMECQMTDSEKAACMGCPERFEWEKEKGLDPGSLLAGIKTAKFDVPTRKNEK
jgi:hypothetical protein